MPLFQHPDSVRPHLESGGASRALFTSLTSRALQGGNAAVMGKLRRRGTGAISPFLPHSTPSPGLAVRDTHSRSGRSLGSSFSVFASRTLWGESEKGVRVVRWAGS